MALWPAWPLTLPVRRSFAWMPFSRSATKTIPPVFIASHHKNMTVYTKHNILFSVIQLLILDSLKYIPMKKLILIISGHCKQLLLTPRDRFINAAACFTHFGQQVGSCATLSPEIKQFAGKLHQASSSFIKLHLTIIPAETDGWLLLNSVINLETASGEIC